MAYLQHDVEGQQSKHNEFVSVKEPTACVVEHHIRAGIQQSLQTNLQQTSLVSITSAEHVDSLGAAGTSWDCLCSRAIQRRDDALLSTAVCVLYMSIVSFTSSCSGVGATSS